MELYEDLLLPSSFSLLFPTHTYTLVMHTLHEQDCGSLWEQSSVTRAVITDKEKKR